MPRPYKSVKRPMRLVLDNPILRPPYFPFPGRSRIRHPRVHYARSGCEVLLEPS